VLPDGSQVRLRRRRPLNLGAESFNVDTKYNGQPASGIGIQLATGANALKTANAVRARLAQLEPYFPARTADSSTPERTTPFIRISIQEVVKTLLEGIALVFLVMFLFLQNIRATLIPSIRCHVRSDPRELAHHPLRVASTRRRSFLACMDALDVFSTSIASMQEEGLSPVEATRKAMGSSRGR